MQIVKTRLRKKQFGRTFNSSIIILNFSHFYESNKVVALLNRFEHFFLFKHQNASDK